MGSITNNLKPENDCVVIENKLNSVQDLIKKQSVVLEKQELA